jgi:hypothetical protein
MQGDQLEMRAALEHLAGHEGGRRLLQLSLRSIESGDHELVSGCWTRKGDAGCLFQHAYWQGVEEGVFADEGRPGDWIGSFVGAGDYGIVIRTIGAFDVLAKDHYADIKRRRLLPDRVEVRQDEWRELVERMLVTTLAAGETRDGGETKEVAAVS